MPCKINIDNIYWWEIRTFLPSLASNYKRQFNTWSYLLMMVLRLIFKRYQEWKNSPKTPHNGKENDKFRKWKLLQKVSQLNVIKKRWFQINNLQMRQERWRFIPNHTKFEVFESLCRIDIFLKWNLWVMLFYKTGCGHSKMTWKMDFLTVPVDTGHQNYFEFEWLIIIL